MKRMMIFFDIFPMSGRKFYSKIRKSQCYVYFLFPSIYSIYIQSLQAISGIFHIFINYFPHKGALLTKYACICAIKFAM